MKKNTIVVLAGVLLLTLNAIVNPSMASRFTETDFDPLVDVEVTVDIQTIRFLEEDASAVNVGGTMVGNFDESLLRKQLLKMTVNQKLLQRTRQQQAMMLIFI